MFDGEHLFDSGTLIAQMSPDALSGHMSPVRFLRTYDPFSAVSGRTRERVEMLRECYGNIAIVLQVPFWCCAPSDSVI